jgi:hypothetical protein
MPCEILIKNTDNINPNLSAEHQRTSLYRRGYPVMGKDYPHPGWGNSEGLPNFIHLRITDASLVEVEQYLQEYIRRLAFVVVNSDSVIDGWRIELVAENLDVSEYAKVNKDTVEGYLNKWGAVVQSFTNVSVTFDVLIFDAIKSRGFWDVKPQEISGLSLTELGYVQGTGLHTEQVDYSNFRLEISDRNKIRKKLIGKIEETGSIYVSDDPVAETINFTCTAETVKQRFLTELRYKYERMIWRRQFYFPTGVMNTIQTYMENNNGDAYETDRITAISYLQNKMNE